MNIHSVTFFSAFETLIKLIAGFVVIKLLAYYSGPEAMAKFGQFQNFLTVITALVSGGFVTGLVKYVSECDVMEGRLSKYKPLDYVNGALTFGLLISVVVAFVLIINAVYLSRYVFSSNEYEEFFYFLPLTLVFIVVYQIVIAYFNGMRMIKKMIVVKLSSSLFLLFSGAFLVYFWGLDGGLISISTMQVFGGGVAIFFIYKTNSFSWFFLKLGFVKKIQYDLLSFWFMSFVTLMSAPMVLFFIRMHIIEQSGWVTAGLWEAVWKITELSLLLVTTALTVYYVPMLSKTSEQSEQITLVFRIMKLALAASLLISLTVYMLKNLVVITLFSKDFLEIINVMKYQLIGGVIRVMGWVIGYHMLIKAKPVLFIFVELVFGVSLFFISVSLFDHYGLIGLSYAFMINNAIYLLFGLLYLKVYFDRSGEKRLIGLKEKV